MLNFNDFRDGPAGQMCERVGLPIDRLMSWRSFANTFQTINKRTDGDLVNRLMHFPASSGERALIMAILCAADYATYADKLSESCAWHWLGSAKDEHAEAVAAVILRRDAFGS